MAIIRRVKKWLSVLCVVAVAVVAGIFLASCRKAAEPNPAPAPPAKTTEPQPSSTPARTTEPKSADPKANTVDVNETEQGQPVPRNLLE